MDDQEWTPLLRVLEGRVSPDRRRLGLELEDVAGARHRFSLDQDAFSNFVVSLLTVAGAARRAREAEGIEDEPGPSDVTVLLPFPVVSYHLGRSEDGERVVLRLTSDNGLHWDFLLPLSAVEDLKRDLGILVQA